tara:strand:+ start:6312 stop:7388 length:1077 start_codon:yes stop_codon:yes gene_type:complete
MEITIVNNLEELKNIKQSWEDLEGRSNYITFYNSFSYVYSWAETHQSLFEKLFIVCVSERKKIIGVAPMMVTKSRAFSVIEFNKLSFLGKGDYFNFLIEDRAKFKPIVTKIFDAINKFEGWDKLDLTHIQKGTDLLKFLLRSTKYNSRTSFFGETPVVLKESHSDFINYKKNHIRKNVNNYYNKLKKDYEIKVKMYWDNEGDILNRIRTIHITRNSIGKNRKSLFTQSNTRSFLQSIYTQNRKTLTFCVENESEIISYVTCYIHGDIIHVWNNSYNIAYERYSPGDIVYMEALKYFFSEECGFRVLDFGGGRYPWKFQMTNDFLSMYRLNLNNKNCKKYKLLQLYDTIFQIGKIALTR